MKSAKELWDKNSYMSVVEGKHQKIMDYNNFKNALSVYKALLRKEIEEKIKKHKSELEKNDIYANTHLDKIEAYNSILNLIGE